MFMAQAYGVELSITQVLVMLGVLMLISKGRCRSYRFRVRNVARNVE